MNVYTENIELLKIKNLPLAKKIEDLEFDESVRVFPSKSGLPTAEILKEGKVSLLHSSYSPQREAETVINSYNFKDVLLVIVMGFGLGYYVKEIINKVENKVHIWIFEADLKLLKLTLQTIDISEILKRDRLHIIDANNVYETKQTLFYEISQLFFPSFPKSHNILFIPHPVLYNHNYKVYKYITDKLKNSIISMVTGFTTEVVEGPRWGLNTVQSIKHVLKAVDIGTMKNRWKNKPAICMGAGPSLDKNIELLNLVKNKALVISVGTTIKPLLKHNIEPDMVCMVDGKFPILDQLKGLPPLSIPLVSDPMVYYEVFEHFIGRKFLCGFMYGWNFNPFLSFIEKYIGEFARPGGAFTVSAVAFSIANLLGANPIILIGQDMAYSTDGRTHALHSPESDNRIDLTSPYYFKVKGNVEDEVYTDHPLFATKSWYVNMVEQNPHLKVVNATEGGAYIEGTEVITLKEAIEKYCYKEYDTSSIFENVPFERKISKKTLEKLKDGFEKLEKQIGNINRLSSYGLKLVKELVYDNVMANTKTKEEKYELQQKIRKNIQDINKFDIAMKILNHFMKDALMFVNKEETQEIDNIIGENEEEKILNRELNKAGVFFESIKEISEFILPYFENVKKL